MATVDAADFAEGFVVHYGGRLHQVDAYTFANSLLALCGAIEEINNAVNPGYGVEITVDALAPGSFRPRIKLPPKTLKAALLWGADRLLAPILVALLVARVSKVEPTIEIKDSVVVVTGDSSTVTLPREAFTHLEALRRNPVVNGKIANAFETLDQDEAITDFGLAKGVDQDPVVSVERSEFPRLSAPRPEEPLLEGRRVVTEAATVVIIRAIFEKSARKWQFAWNGVRISAPITDQEFFDKLRRREIELGWGDTLEVDLRIVQVLDPETQVYLNESYEIVKVRGHERAPEQRPLLPPP